MASSTRTSSSLRCSRTTATVTLQRGCVLVVNNDADNKPSLQVFEIFDTKQNSVIEFGEFVRSLSAFHPNAPLREKADCAWSTDAIPHTSTLHSLFQSV